MAPFNAVLIVAGILTALFAIGVFIYILYDTSKAGYRRFRSKVSEYYFLRRRIKQWEEEELNREYPREWYGSN